jgi:hypothetical protein
MVEHAVKEPYDGIARAKYDVLADNAGPHGAA